MLATAGLLATTLTACGSAVAGTPVPNGEDAATYVSAKFDDTLEGLSDQLNQNETRKTRTDTVVRFDEKRINQTISAVQLGHPPARLSRNHSNIRSDEYLDSFHPADSPVEYLQLGPLYAGLAPTPWVQMPYTAGQYNECYWEGMQSVCKLLGSMQTAVEAGRAMQSANSKPDGSLELVANVSLSAFIEQDVVTFPATIENEFTADMKAQTFRTRVTLDPRGKLTEIQMQGKITGNGHELEVDIHYRLDGTPSENDLPKVPDPSQVTVLSNSAAVNDFYARMGEIQGG
ncbi:hypothetical protein GCM10027445_51630 [Amycolatopsis endophytica]|uniref:Lipoprotein n=1 Tax=Amycolatopsis endophytica TaxID=860233 RepID=A0A853AYS7_9PSEU|nr:hypothetical protein [Amycolatopsis endophytica]NYI87764.1 hypothetical protein [Amycolatopsis endophytica]